MSKDRVININKTNIETLPYPGKGSVFYQDTKDKYFCIKVTTSNKYYYLRKYIRGKVRYIKIGDYPALTPTLARKEYVKKYSMLIEGKNPIEEKRQLKRQMALQELFNLYTAEKEGIKKSLRQDKLYFKSSLDDLKGLKLTAISYDKVKALHKNLHNKPYMANRILALLSALFNYAIRELRLELKNPCTGIKKYKEYPKHRILNHEELKRFYEICNQWTEYPYLDFYGDLFLLLLYTGQRKTNVLEMKYSNIDFITGEWTIKPEEAKNSEFHILPLSNKAFDILKKRKEGNKNKSDFVFNSQVKQNAPVKEIKRYWAKFLEEAEIKDFSIHDLRRTAGSILLKQTGNLKAVQKYLGHKDIATTARVYAHVLNDDLRNSLNEAF